MQVSKVPVGLSARGAAPASRGDAANAAVGKEPHSVIHNAVEVFISNKARAMNQEADRQGKILERDTGASGSKLELQNMDDKKDSVRDSKARLTEIEKQLQDDSLSADDKAILVKERNQLKDEVIALSPEDKISMIYGLKDQVKKALEESMGTFLSRDSASDATALREIAEMEKNSSGLDGWLAEAKQEERELTERENRLNAQARGEEAEDMASKMKSKDTPKTVVNDDDVDDGSAERALSAKNLEILKQTAESAEEGDISADGSQSIKKRNLALRNEKPHSVQQTIWSTFYLMETMKREADSFMRYDYDEQTSNDISLASNTIRNLINKMWKSSTVTRPTRDEWSEHGIYQYDRRVIVHGPMDVRSCMTDLFSDSSFNSKAEAEDSYATIKRAYRVLSSYM